MKRDDFQVYIAIFILAMTITGFMFYGSSMIYESAVKEGCERALRAMGDQVFSGKCW